MDLTDKKPPRRTFDFLFQPHMYSDPTSPQYYTRAQLLAATGITPRQLHYYIQSGAVSRPIGNTRAAKYTLKHLNQVQRVLALLGEREMTVAEIAEAFAPKRSNHARSRKPHAQPTKSTKEVIYRVTEGVRIVASDALSPSEQVILRRLLAAGQTTVRERSKLALEAISGNAVPGRRKP